MTSHEDRNDRAKNLRNYGMLYTPDIADTKNEQNDEINIKGPVLAAATSLSSPILSHTGTRTIAPPSPTAPPISPAVKP